MLNIWRQSPNRELGECDALIQIPNNKYFQHGIVVDGYVHVNLLCHKKIEMLTPVEYPRLQGNTKYKLQLPGYYL